MHQNNFNLANVTNKNLRNKEYIDWKHVRNWLTSTKQLKCVKGMENIFIVKAQGKLHTMCFCIQQLTNVVHINNKLLI